jgi:tRNA-specific 2-thiouridylase
VCDRLGIPHYVLNMEEPFRERVVDYFIDEYANGRTPNPCLACNDRVKFRPLLQKALAFDADYLATGHYARVRHGGSDHRLLKAADPAKDQSYVLFQLGQEELRHVLFPVGDATKPEIRAAARRFGLPNADKPDSVDICFIPSGDLKSFVGGHIDPRPGEIVDTSGNVIGEHGGIATLTVGQRKGLGVARGEPLYVIALDAFENRVVAGRDEELYSDALRAEDVRWVAGHPPAEEFRCTARIRYRAPEAHVTVRTGAEPAAAGRHASIEVRFDEPQRAVTPGQAVVLYDGEGVLGGGIIARR